MKIVALLPMKGHSERVPNKNMKEFAGAPLYHAIVKTLLKAKHVSKVVINTDSELIKKDALSNFQRVEIIDRPKEIQGDFVSMNDIIKYDISQIDGDMFLQTHSTNPLLLSESIDNAISKYFELTKEYDSVFSVTKWQTRLYWENAKPLNHNPKELLRTQDLPPVFEENSNFYIFSRESFRRAGDKRIGLNPYMFEINKLESIDIDIPEDFEIAETLYKKLLTK